jgi:hypothetical protein
MEDFPPAQIVDYHQTQGREVAPPRQSTEMVLYNPEILRLRPSRSRDQDQDNLQERLGQLVRDLVYVSLCALEKLSYLITYRISCVSTLDKLKVVTYLQKEVSALMKEADAEIVKALQAEYDSSRRNVVIFHFC